MSLSYAELERVVAEVRPLLVGGRLQNVAQPTPTTVVLSLYARGERRHLLIATEPRFARLHLVADRPPGTGEVPPFARSLRQALRGRALLSLELTPGDRVVELCFGSRDAPAGRLVAELTGRTSNLIHLAANGRILAVLRPVRKAARELRPGAAYEPPPPPPSPSRAHRENRFADAAAADGALSAAIDRFYADAEQHERVASLRRSLASRLKAERKRTLRRLANLEADIGKAGDADELRLRGELLKPHLHDVPPRATSITVPNVFDPAQPDIEIPLRPTLSARQNMERYFKRYKKLLVARERAGERAAQARRRLDEIDAGALAVQEASTLDELEALAAEHGRPAAQRRKAPTRAPGPNRFVSADGLDILVGRTRAENDELTFRIARGNDVWLHVEGYTGSHVVVRLPKGKTVPKETLLDAAALAIRFSQLRNAGAGPVAYCACKYVRKPKGAKPGQALYSQSKTLHVTVERSRLERLLRREE